MFKDLEILASSFTDNTTGLEKYFELKSLRRMDFFSRLALKAAVKCLTGANVDATKENIGLIIASGYGPVKRTCDFMDSIIFDGDECASPSAFSTSVHNSALTSLSILLKLRCPAVTISNLETSFDSALALAKTWLAGKMVEKVLLGIVDEEHSVAKDINDKNPDVFVDFKNKEFGYGAAFFLLKNSNIKTISMDNSLSIPFNPSKKAFKFAKENSLILDKEDINSLVCDYAKTELSKKGCNILSVFEENNIENILKDTGIKLKESILHDLPKIFSDKNIKIDANNIVDDCFKLFKQNKIINFLTSGSTGISKQICHSQDEIKEEADSLKPLFAQNKRAICLVPIFHSYGFIFGMQIPKVLDIPAIKMPPIPTFNWDNFLNDGDLLIAFPMFLKQIVSLDIKFSKKITILTSTAPCPNEIIESLYKNGINNLIEIYGASEGGAIGYRTKANTGFNLLSHWNATIKDNVLVSIKRKNTDMTFEMPDNIEILNDLTFKPVSRKDKAVQVAGINVYPQKVKNILKSLPEIDDIAVRLMRQDEGEHLKAFIVLKQNTNKDEFLKKLSQYMKENLSVHEIPKKITFGKQIPTTDFGKLKDW